MLTEVRNDEAKLLAYLNRHTPDKSHKLVDIWQGQILMDICRRIEVKPFQKVEDITEMFVDFGFSDGFAADLAAELVEYAYSALLEKAEERLSERMHRHQLRGANRANYLFETVFKYYQLEDDRWRWRYDPELRSWGLMSLIIKNLHGHQPEPVAIGVLIDDETQQHENAKGNPKAAMRAMVKSGVAVSGARLGWNMNSPAWPMLIKAFPEAIPFSAYCHGLNAPVLPEGFLTDVRVGFTKLTTPDGTDLETDGSGIYHPDCPALAKFVARYGTVAFQPRLLYPKKGLFAKGVLFPSENALVDGEPGIIFDWKMVKGKHKEQALKYRADGETKSYEGCYVGILQAWHRATKLSASFEMLENLQTTPRTKQIVQILVRRAMEQLEKKGMNGLAAEVARKDPIIKLMLQLVQAGRQAGLNIHAWQIPRVREAIKDRLARRLYTIAQGGGLKLPSYVCRMDATIPRGHCVITGMKPGRKVVGFRFPIVLPQGLLCLETIRAPKHLKCQGEVTPFTVVMNPHDATLNCQGDDDGDQFGFTDDPLIVELVENNRLDNDTFLIEPKGLAKRGSDGLPLKSDSPEGLEYLQDDHRGPVGRCTVWRARLLAVGDYAAARAMSIAIQECIDQAKRVPEWSDIREATNLANWTRDKRGNWTFNIRFKPEDLEDDQFPMALIKDWVDGRLIQAGCSYIARNEDGEEIVKAKDPTWWRHRGKRIDIDNWSIPPSTEESERFENLVHAATREARKCWLELAEEFLTTPGSVPIELLLPVVFSAKGIPTKPPNLSEAEWLRLKNKTGLSAYNSRLAALLNPNSERDDTDIRPRDEEEFKHYTRSISTLQAALEERLKRGLNSDDPDNCITLDEVMTIWVRETGPGGNPNNAFRVICWDGSPILDLLGITEPTKCSFLYRGKIDRLAWLSDQAIAAPDPFDKLREPLLASRRHGEGYTKDGILIEEPVVDGNGVPVHIWDCPDCLAAAQNHLVRTLRLTHKSREQGWLAELHSNLKKG